MSKGYLIVDMPSCCGECAFLNDNCDYPECTITNEMRGYNFKVYERKMENCPIRELIEKGDDKDILIASLKVRLNRTNEMLLKAYQIIGEVIEI